jgi:cell wall-associated NlpC family hydrolase
MSLALRPSLRAGRIGLLAIVATISVVLLAGLMPAKANAAVVTPGSRMFGIKVVAEAAKHKHAQYAYGASGPRRFDCSGFTSYVIRKSTGKRLPHSAAGQYRSVKHIRKTSIRPGDLVFYRSRSGHVFHVGIYAGHGRIWHASNPRTDVKLGKIYNSNWAAGRLR